MLRIVFIWSLGIEVASSAPKQTPNAHGFEGNHREITTTGTGFSPFLPCPLRNTPRVDAKN